MLGEYPLLPGDVYYFAANSSVVCVKGGELHQSSLPAQPLSPNTQLTHIYSPTLLPLHPLHVDPASSPTQQLVIESLESL